MFSYNSTTKILLYQCNMTLHRFSYLSTSNVNSVQMNCVVLCVLTLKLPAVVRLWNLRVGYIST